jgi:hypothetical protein
MKVLSIRQPWAWLIVNGHKDVENRSWETFYRGPILIHAGKTMARVYYDAIAESVLDDFDIALPAYEQLERGGIVGKAELYDCRRELDSRWKDPDSFGFLLSGAVPLPFRRATGKLGIFDLQVCRECGCTDEHACEGGCYWFEPELCSRCVPLRPIAALKGLVE